MVLDPATRITSFLHARDYLAAERLLGTLLEREPGDAPTRSLRALCLAELERFPEAEAEGRTAVETEPYLAYCHWALGTVLADRRRWAKAALSAQEALDREPDNADHHALLGRCMAALGRWDEALAAAEAGLREEPDHPPCANLRALVMQHRGSPDDADQAFIDAAAMDPDNGFARAGRGWSALRRGGAPGPAIQHFEHALRIDPASEWAREGLLAALKARNPVYRMMLRYFLWMGGLPPRTRMFIIVGGVIGYNQVRRLSEARPELMPALLPLMIAYGVFVLMSWVADPLFDFLLRFDAQGRRMVPRDRAVAANTVVAALGAAVYAVLAAVASGNDEFFLLALVLGAMVIPLAGTFQCEPGWPRRVMACWTAGALATGVVGFLMPGTSGDLLVLVSLFGMIAGSWLAMGLTRVVPAR